VAGSSKGISVKNSDRFLPFLAGVGLGVGIAFLFAPCAGSTTRDRIIDATSKGADALKEQASALQNKSLGAGELGKRAWRGELDKRDKLAGGVPGQVREVLTGAAGLAQTAAQRFLDTSREAAGDALDSEVKRIQAS
jgi:hypothetical protein